MKIFFILLIFTCLLVGLGSCDDGETVDSAEAVAACDDYCEKLFDCGITLPADMTEDQYQDICDDDCYDALTGASTDSAQFEIENNCGPLDCDVSADCGTWHQCINDCG